MTTTYDTTLQKAMDFAALHGILDAEDLLASKQKPCGVAISIPPQGVAGTHVRSNSYESAQTIFQEGDRLVGQADANQPDHPL